VNGGKTSGNRADDLEPLLPIERASVLFDGIFAEPKLSHPEGVAIGPDGWIWCGNQDGDLLRVSPDGRRMERVASTDGFALGLAFDAERACYLCDLRHAAVFRFALDTGTLSRLRADGLRIPNYPLVDRANGRLLVSDSHASGTPGPGIWSFPLDGGDGTLWYREPLDFANGLAVREGEAALYVCETFSRKITRIPIEPDGTAGEARPFAEHLPGLPDGIAFDRTGRLVVGCYEPSRLLRVSADGRDVELLIEDPTAHVLCHPTNIAFDGDTLYTANLGRWHLTRVAMDVGAEPLWSRST